MESELADEIGEWEKRRERERQLAMWLLQNSKQKLQIGRLNVIGPERAQKA